MWRHKYTNKLYYGAVRVKRMDIVVVEYGVWWHMGADGCEPEDRTCEPRQWPGLSIIAFIK